MGREEGSEDGGGGCFVFFPLILKRMLIDGVYRVTFVWRRGWAMQMPSKNSRSVLRMGRGARRTGRSRRSGTAPLYVHSRSDPRHWLILTLTLGRARHERRRAAVDIQGEISVTIFRVVRFLSFVFWISQPTYVFITLRHRTSFAHSSSCSSTSPFFLAQLWSPFQLSSLQDCIFYLFSIPRLPSHFTDVGPFGAADT